MNIIVCIKQVPDTEALGQVRISQMQVVQEGHVSMLLTLGPAILPQPRAAISIQLSCYAQEWITRSDETIMDLLGIIFLTWTNKKVLCG